MQTRHKLKLMLLHYKLNNKQHKLINIIQTGCINILTCRFTLSITQPFVILNTEKIEDSAGDIGGRVFGESVASGSKLAIFLSQLQY